MSTKAMGRLYTNSHGQYVPPAGNRAPLVSQLLGQDKLSGGLSTGANGDLSFIPYQGSGGFFGGWSRNRAADLNAQLGIPLLEGQEMRKTSKQEAEQTQAQTKLEAELKNKFMDSEQIRAIASKLDIPVSELSGSIAKELAANALQEQQNVGAALKNPSVQASYPGSLIARNQAQDASNRQKLALQTGVGGTATMPGPNMKGNTVIKGAVPTQTTTMVGSGPRDPATGQPMMQTPVVNQSYIPGQASFPPQPIDPSIAQAAAQVGNGSMQPANVPTPQTATDQEQPQSSMGSGTKMPSLLDYFNSAQSGNQINPALLGAAGLNPDNGLQSGANVNDPGIWQQILQFLNTPR